MTRWGVERTPRTAHQPTPVPPAGVSALMPPPSQGAERRTERHTPRIRSRWGLRALVIGGLAGAAWLLTGAAAHAADRVPAPEGDLLGASSLVGSMQHGDDAIPVVTRVLRAAARPPEPSHHLRIPDLVQEPVVGVLTEVTNGSTEALGGVTHVVRDFTTPSRPTGGPPDAPVTRQLRPAADVMPSAAISQPAAAVGSTANQQKPRNVATKGARGIAGAVGHGRFGATYRHHTAVEADAPEAVRAAPAGDETVPLQGYLGAIGAIPVAGQGGPTEGGSAAFLPIAVGEHAVASHRLPPAAGVEARHNDAEAPTVSPD